MSCKKTYSSNYPNGNAFLGHNGTISQHFGSIPTSNNHLRRPLIKPALSVESDDGEIRPIDVDDSLPYISTSSLSVRPIGDIIEENDSYNGTSRCYSLNVADTPRRPNSAAAALNSQPLSTINEIGESLLHNARELAQNNILFSRIALLYR